jgi:sulfate transport system permease protein
VLIPLAALVMKTATMGWDDLVRVLLEPRAVASYKLSFGAALLAATVNSVFGFHHRLDTDALRIPGRKLIDALIDMPFALPTAVSGIALTAVFAENGWIGQYLAPYGIKVAYTWIGIVVALTLIGLPSWCARCSPALARSAARPRRRGLKRSARRASRSFRRIILPTVAPAIATGFTMAFARAVGEYGSVIFIAGQPADEDRDHAAPDRDQAGAVRLRRRCGARLRDAGAVVRHAALDQLCCSLGRRRQVVAGR